MMERESRARPDSPLAAAMVSTGTATVVIVACGFATGLIAARSLGPAGRGELAAITLWASVLLYAGTLGLPEAVAYFSAVDPHSRDRVWTTAHVGGAALGLLVTVVGWVLIPVLFSAGEAALAQTIRWYLVLFAVPAMWSLCATSWLQGAGRMRAFNLSRAAVPVTNAAGLSILWAFGDRSVVHFACVLLVGNATGWLVAAGFGPLARIAAAPPTRDLAKRMLRYGVRVQLGNWSNAASVRLDQLLLSLFAPAASLGLYVVAVSYAGVLMMIPVSASLVMLPEVVRQHQAGAARACLERWCRGVLWATCVGGAVIAPLGVVALPALFGSAFQGAVPLAALLVPATVLLGMNQVLSTAFRGIGRPEIGSTSEVVGVAVTIGALAALLPRYGIYGAAIASLLAYGASHLYLARKAVIVFESDVRSLYIPTRDDLTALRHACVRVVHRSTRGPSERPVRIRP
jgi:O-antigen/teichoic acid export membrane protein